MKIIGHNRDTTKAELDYEVGSWPGGPIPKNRSTGPSHTATFTEGKKYKSKKSGCGSDVEKIANEETIKVQSKNGSAVFGK